MHNRHRLRMLKKAFKMAGADKIIILYLICFILLSVAIWIWEPGIDGFFDSLWFWFATATSIGYGDYSAVTFLGRILSVFLSVYSIGVIAVFTGVIASYYTDIVHWKANDSVREFMDKLENLSELSKEELEELSQKVKNFEKKLDKK